MRLHALLDHAAIAFDRAAVADVELSGIIDDSRRVSRGDLFIARNGTKSDGATFARDAVARGAVAVLSQTPIDGLGVPQIASPRLDVSRLAQTFFGDPSRSLKLLAITGTNGKTTTAYLVRHILRSAGVKCGLMGTVEIDDGKSCVESELTTPGACDLARCFAAMVANDCAAAVMETSSHALHQGRAAGLRFAGGGFTNLTGDHLDYHKTMDAYADAKAILFETMDDAAIATLNLDDPAHLRMRRNTRARVVTFSPRGNEQADYFARDSKVTSAGTSFVLHTPDGNAPVHMSLIGRHNIENALCAASLAMEVFGVSVSQIVRALHDAGGAPGRLQRVDAGQAFAVLVDYAHTDDALENVLSALRPITRGRLRVVFGCGGDRDPTKRPRMARVAEKYADAIYVTSDNPRTENPQKILDEIRVGFQRMGEYAVVELDRRLAIEQALADAAAGDVVLIAGKGHENYQIIGTTKHHFDDVEEARRVLTRAQRAVG